MAWCGNSFFFPTSVPLHGRHYQGNFSSPFEAVILNLYVKDSDRGATWQPHFRRRLDLDRSRGYSRSSEPLAAHRAASRSTWYLCDRYSGLVTCQMAAFHKPGLTRPVVGRDVGVGVFPRARAYARAADARSPNCFAGASAIRATPMIMSAVTAPSRPARSFGMWTAITAITAP